MSFWGTRANPCSRDSLCSLTKFFCLNIHKIFSRPTSEIWFWHLNEIESWSQSFRRATSCPEIPLFWPKYKHMNIETIDIWLMSLWVTFLINKIILFQYSEEISLAHRGTGTLTLGHNRQLNLIYLTSYKLSQNSPLWRIFEPMNTETIEIC